MAREIWTFFQKVLALGGFALLFTLIGVAIGVMYALRGAWREYFGRIAPPVSDPQLRFILKQCQNRGIITRKQLVLLEAALWEHAKMDEEAAKWAVGGSLTAADRLQEQVEASRTDVGPLG